MSTPSKYSPCVGIRTCSDYSPFGVELDGRTVSGGYRYGYQGSEKDNEAKGSGNSYTTEFRHLDPRLGRWLNVDPKSNATESTYSGLGNNPNLFNDILGDTIKRTTAFDKEYYNSYIKFSQSKAGKKFIEDFSIGGKYEHVSVVFDVLNYSEAGFSGQTSAFAMPKKPSIIPVALDGIQFTDNSLEFAQNKSTDYYLEFRIQLHPNGNCLDGYNSKELERVKNGAVILHETQHVMLGILGLMNKNIARIPLSYDQHTDMNDSNKEFYWQRVNYWWQFTPIWYNDFKKRQKEESNQSSKQIYTPINYIHEKDQFFY